MENDRLGHYGEQYAERYLARHHEVEVLDRRWRCPLGELDLVVREPDGTIVFVEVKTRATASFGAPFEAVDRRKVARLRRLAAAWLSARDEFCPLVRIDVISIAITDGHADLEHLQDVA